MFRYSISNRLLYTIRSPVPIPGDNYMYTPGRVIRQFNIC